MHAERRLSVHKLLCALEHSSSSADKTSIISERCYCVALWYLLLLQRALTLYP
jgi:hypothetical protein